MGSETAWGLASLIGIIAFVCYAFYQGSKVRRPTEGTPPDRSADLTFLDGR
jgi:hypothetical protein